MTERSFENYNKTKLYLLHKKVIYDLFLLFEYFEL